MPETIHKIYGRVWVDAQDLATDKPFIRAKLLNPRANLPTTIMVGKVALKDCGGYVTVPRGEPLAKKYLPLAYSLATQMRLPEEDWEEIVSIAFEYLTRAAATHQSLGEANGFADFARVRVVGGILNKRKKDIRESYNKRQVERGYEMFVERVKTAEEKLIELEDEYDLLGAVEQLLEEDSDIIHMYFYGEMSMQQIADHIGVSKMAISKKISKLCRDLRDILVTPK